MSKKTNIRFVIRIAKWDKLKTGFNLINTKYYIHKRYVDKYFREMGMCKVKLTEVETGSIDKDYNDLVALAFNDINKGCDLSKYIEDVYPEWMV